MARNFGTIGSLFTAQQLVAMKEKILSGQSARHADETDAQLREEARRLGVSLASKRGYERVVVNLRKQGK